jgi:hypothetical protein
VDSGQADVSGRHAIPADLLQVSQEGNHEVWFNVPKIQLVNPALSLRSQKTKEEQ